MAFSRNAGTVLVLTALFSLGGCATAPTHPQSDPVAKALEQSTQRVSHAWQQIGAIAQAQHPQAVDQLDDYRGKLPAALAQKVSERWAGPIAGLVSHLTSHIGWSFKKVGTTPPNGVPVFIDTNNKAIGEILRNVGYQAGDRAEVIVHPDEKLVELAYE